VKEFVGLAGQPYTGSIYSGRILRYAKTTNQVALLSPAQSTIRLTQKNTLNIILDAKVLAIAARTGNRSGVYRYASVLADQLIATPGIHLRTICTDLLDTPWSWHEKQQRKDLNTQSIKSWAEYFRLKEIADRNKQKIQPYNKSSWKAGSLNALKHLKYMPTLAALNKVRLNLQLCAAKGAIFHSPFHLVPDEVSTMRHLSIVRTIHDVLPLSMPHFFLEESAKRFKEAMASITNRDHIICISDCMRNEIMRIAPWLREDRLYVIPLAGDTTASYVADEADWQVFCEHYGIERDEKILLAVGTIEPRKNHVNLIAGFELATQLASQQRLRLILVGGLGWQFNPILARIQNTPVCNQIIMLGSIPDPLLACLYAKATATLSVSWAEGFGLPILESMRYGTPVIASAIPAHLEIATDAAYFIDPKSPLEIGRGIQQLTESTTLKQHWGKLGKLRAEEFSWDKTVKATVKCYQEISNKKG
jgi:glycosyltransferase involved in cell wall biosynthesis